MQAPIIKARETGTSRCKKTVKRVGLDCCSLY